MSCSVSSFWARSATISPATLLNRKLTPENPAATITWGNPGKVSNIGGCSGPALGIEVLKDKVEPTDPGMYRVAKSISRASSS